MHNQFIQLPGVPFDDDKAKYDNDIHQYIPEFDYIKKRTGVDLIEEFGDTNDAKAELFGMVDAAYDIIGV